jgi:phosphopantetheine binding protein
MANSNLNSTEELVSQMWGQIIGVHPTSVDDDFFELGGYSIHLVEFLQEVLSVFAVELDMVDLFNAGFTVAESARAIDRARSGQGSVSSGRPT